MTKMWFVYSGNLIKGFRMKGHAGYGESGKDILCSALSATSQMTINGIADWIGIDMDEHVLRHNQEKGELIILLPKGHYEHMVVQQLLKSFEMYIIQLADIYPDNLSIKRRVEFNDNTNS